MQLQELYGKNILKFKLSLSARGLSQKFIPVTIDMPRSNIAPARGCDIIIHGESANSARIFPLHPDCITNLTRTYTFDGEFIGSMFGYCFEEDKETVVDLFKEALREPTRQFCLDQLKQIEAISTYLSLSPLEPPQ